MFYLNSSISLFSAIIISQFILNKCNVEYFIGTDNSGTLTASEVCNNAGGRLAIIDSSSEFTEASSVASSSGYLWVVVALHCTSRDTSCSQSTSKWTWFDSQNNNQDLCDISVGGMDDLSLYQTWDQWNKIPEQNEYCVEFYGGKLVLEFCSNINGIIIDSDTELPNAALCQPLSYSISSCTDYTVTNTTTKQSALSFYIKYVVVGVGVLVLICFFMYRWYKKKDVDDTKASYSAIDNVPVPAVTVSVPRVVTDVNINRNDVVGLKGCLPDGWRVAYTADGNRYYQNDITKETRWNIPNETGINIGGINNNRTKPSVPVIEDVTLSASTNANGSESVRHWMENTVGFPQYTDCLIVNGYDSLQVIMDIRDKTDLGDIGITMKGHQNRIMKQIEMLKNGRCDTQITQNIDNVAIVKIDSANMEGTSGGTGNGAEGYY